MEEKSDYKDKIAKIRRLSQKTTRKLEGSKKLIEIAKEVMKKQFDKKRRNPQRLKVGENM